MNEQMIEQHSLAAPYEAATLTCEVSDEALEAAGGNGFGGVPTGFSCVPTVGGPGYYCR